MQFDSGLQSFICFYPVIQLFHLKAVFPACAESFSQLYLVLPSLSEGFFKKNGFRRCVWFSSTTQRTTAACSWRCTSTNRARSARRCAPSSTTRACPTRSSRSTPSPRSKCPGPPTRRYHQWLQYLVFFVSGVTWARGVGVVIFALYTHLVWSIFISFFLNSMKLNLFD